MSTFDAGIADAESCGVPDAGNGSLADWCAAFCAAYDFCFDDSPVVPADQTECRPWCETELGDCGPDFVPAATCCLVGYCSLLEECVFRGPGATCF